MWETLIRIFSDAERPAAPAPPPPSPQRQALEQNVQTVTLEPTEEFFRFLLGVSAFHDMSPQAVEKMVVQQLDKLLSAPVFDERVVPRLPTVVPQLLSALRSDEVSGKDLAEQVGRDPVLVGEVIRIANSAYYQTTQKINSLERAIVMIGRIGLQRLIANVMMRPIFNAQGGRISQRAGQYLWSQSERCALACSYLSRGLYEPFDAYLAGIVCRTGLIVAVRIMDQANINKDLSHSHAFYQMLLNRTQQLSLRIATSWEFPQRVLGALGEEQNAAETSSSISLGQLLIAAECISQLHMLVEVKRLPDDIDLLNQRLGNSLSDRQIKCYKELKKLMESNAH